MYPYCIFLGGGGGWGFKGWERGFEPNYPPQEVYVIFLEQHMLKSVFFFFNFYFFLLSKQG